MTSIPSLLACATSDLTLDHVTDLLGQAPPEGVMLEYKVQESRSLVKSIAAMVNTHGGLILVGVDDKRKVVGVPAAMTGNIVNSCVDMLDPPWQPEIVPLPLPRKRDKFVLVIRIYPDRAPRPLLIDGRAYVRWQGGNAPADREHLSRLFEEQSTQATAAVNGVAPPQLPTGSDGLPTVDFMVRTGIALHVGERARWRPFSERTMEVIIESLHRSPLDAMLLKWANNIGQGGLNPWIRTGFNRAHVLRLLWQDVAGSPEEVVYPLEAQFDAKLGENYARPGSVLAVTMDVVCRLPTLWRRVGTPQPWRLEVDRLEGLLDTAVATFVDPAVVVGIAELADADPVVVPQPSAIHLLANMDMTDLLATGGLSLIPDAGGSRGAQMFADPSLDLRESTDRRIQVFRWVVQVAEDAGLTGMEAVLVRLHPELGAS